MLEADDECKLADKNLPMDHGVLALFVPKPLVPETKGTDGLTIVFRIRRSLYHNLLPALLFALFDPPFVWWYCQGEVDIALQVPVVSVAVEQFGDEFWRKGDQKSLQQKTGIKVKKPQWCWIIC